MIQSYHHGRFEFFVAIIVIAIIAIAALGRYSLIAQDARILRLEIISNHFITGAANARVQLLLENIATKNSHSHHKMQVADQHLYFSPQGWPASVAGVVTESYRPDDNDCYSLWQLLLQNPAPITKGIEAKSIGEYRVMAKGDACHYQFEVEDAYFDYFPLSGQLVFEHVGS